MTLASRWSFVEKATVLSGYVSAVMSAGDLAARSAVSALKAVGE